MWLEIIGILVGVAAIGVTICIAVRAKQLFRPKLTFSIGLTSLYGSRAMSDISTIAFGSNILTKDDAVAFCFYVLTNNSKLPISNVTLQLEYLAEYVIRSDENKAIIEGIDYKILARFSKTKSYDREVSLLGPIAQVRYTIPVLRIGETVVISDAMKFANSGRRKETDFESVTLRGSLENLLKVERVLDFCIVDAFVQSETCLPIAKRVKIIWFNADSLEELLSTLKEACDAIWGGRYPEPGLYMHWLRKVPLKVEYVEAIIAKLNPLITSASRSVWFEDPLESDRSIIGFNMPPWDYYQSSEGKIPGRLVRRLPQDTRK